MGLWQTVVQIVRRRYAVFEGDDYIDRMKEQERAALEAANDARRRANRYDDEFFPRRKGQARAE